MEFSAPASLRDPRLGLRRSSSCFSERMPAAGPWCVSQRRLCWAEPPLRGKVLIWRGACATAATWGGLIPPDLRCSLLRRATPQREIPGCGSSALSRSCCRPSVRPRWDRPFPGIHRILPLKANSEHLSPVPARSLLAAWDCSRSPSCFREEHVSVYLGRAAKRRLGMLSSFGTLANCLQESLTPTRNICFLEVFLVFFSWRGGGGDLACCWPLVKRGKAAFSACPPCPGTEELRLRQTRAGAGTRR